MYVQISPQSHYKCQSFNYCTWECEDPPESEWSKFQMNAWLSASMDGWMDAWLSADVLLHSQIPPNMDAFLMQTPGENLKKKNYLNVASTAVCIHVCNSV